MIASEKVVKIDELQSEIQKCQIEYNKLLGEVKDKQTKLERKEKEVESIREEYQVKFNIMRKQMEDFLALSDGN